jgi:hypothetical protein
MAFSTNGTERMRITAAGDVGIGTGSPQRKFQVTGDAGIGVLPTAGDGITTLSAVSTGITTLDVYHGTIPAQFVVRTNTTGGGGTSEKFRIDGSGNVMIGATSASGKLTVINAAANTDSIWVNMTSTAGPNYGISIVSASAAVSTSAFFRGFVSTGTMTYQVAGSGNVTNTNNSYGAISDVKLKTDIVDTSPKLEDLKKVRIVNYKFKADPDGQKHIGVIAQELEQVFPGLVEETPDMVDGTLTGQTTKAVKYSVFVPILIKALQEALSEIDSLKARVAALEI